MSHEQISLLDENYRYEVAEQQFRDNREPRCPVIMIYDCSRSMQGGLMDEVKRGHELLQQELLEDSIASLRADMSYILYGSEVDPPSLFATVLESAGMPEETRPSNLNFRDMLGTSTNTAILAAIDVVEERLKHYGNKVPHYAPMIFLITDGESLDDNLPHESGKTMRQAAIEALDKRVAVVPGSRRDSLRDGSSKPGKWIFMPLYISTGNADDDKKMRESLQDYPSAPSPVPVPLDPGNMIQFFKWVSESMQKRSESRPDEAVSFPDAPSWVMPGV